MVSITSVTRFSALNLALFMSLITLTMSCSATRLRKRKLDWKKILKLDDPSDPEPEYEGFRPDRGARSILVTQQPPKLRRVKDHPAKGRKHAADLPVADGDEVAARSSRAKKGLFSALRK